VLRRAARPLRLEEIAASLGPASAAAAPAELEDLVRRGELVLNRRGQYCLREQLPGLVVGTVQAQRNGDGLLLPDDASAPVHLTAHEMRAVMHGDRVAARIEGARIRGRQQGAIVEDPGTGSACANLGGWLLATGAALPQRLSVSQGEAVGRPCRLGLAVGADRSIRVSGRVIELGRGTIALPP